MVATQRSRDCRDTHTSAFGRSASSTMLMGDQRWSRGSSRAIVSRSQVSARPDLAQQMAIKSDHVPVALRFLNSQVVAPCAPSEGVRATC